MTDAIGPALHSPGCATAKLHCCVRFCSPWLSRRGNVSFLARDCLNHVLKVHAVSQRHRYSAAYRPGMHTAAFYSVFFLFFFPPHIFRRMLETCKGTRLFSSLRTGPQTRHTRSKTWRHKCLSPAITQLNESHLQNTKTLIR